MFALALSKMADTTPKNDSFNLDDCVLPQGFDAQSFTSAFTDLQDIVGTSNVEIVRTTELKDKSYHSPPVTHDPFHILDQDAFIASCVVCPASTEQVQAIMKAANTHHIPLWPVSIGRNFGYGGAAPRVRGSVVVDLGRRMNKILEINEPGAFALVEPGVTFQGLYDAIKKRGLNFTIDVPDLGGGSVLGNTVERGVGYTPYGDHFMIHCGMEVVLPNGEVVRTGMGSMPDSRQATGSANTWQLFPYGEGLSIISSEYH
jgi:FAD/FMN-containing dehydrogenase